MMPGSHPLGSERRSSLAAMAAMMLGSHPLGTTPHFESLRDRARAPMTTDCTGGTAELAEAPAFAVACNIFGVGAA